MWWKVLIKEHTQGVSYLNYIKNKIKMQENFVDYQLDVARSASLPLHTM